MDDERNTIPDREEIERRKKEIRDTMCCPHCGEQLKKWAVPQTLFTTWPNDYMYICFNDNCDYLLRGFEAAARVGNAGSFRLMYDPETDSCQPVPVFNKQSLRESIVEESDECHSQEDTGVTIQAICGNWKLVSSKMVSADGQASYPLGQEPQGMLMYFEDGRMSVQNMPADGALFQTPEGSVVALETYGAYSGRYEIEGGDKIVHHIDNSMFPDWNGRDQKRTIKIENDRLTLISPLLLIESKLQMAHMAWKRTS